MTIEQDDAGVAVVVLEGEQEAFHAQRLSPELSSLLRGRSPVVVDLSRTTFVDSTTLGVLLAAQREAARVGCGFVLEMDASIAFDATRIFEITGLGAFFMIAGTRPDALAAARAGSFEAQPEGDSA